MLLDIDPVKKNGINLQVKGLRVIISGNIDVRHPGDFMTHFFQKVHKQILVKKITSIEVDITKLEYMNSSGIQEMVAWIMKIDELPVNKKYLIKFLCNPEILWQEASISTFTFLNPDYVKNEFVTE